MNRYFYCLKKENSHLSIQAQMSKSWRQRVRDEGPRAGAGVQNRTLDLKGKLSALGLLCQVQQLLVEAVAIFGEGMDN